MGTETTNQKNSNPNHPKTSSAVKRISQYLLLFLLFILLASHENINPKLGDSHIDFYSENSQRLLEIHSKAFQLNSGTTETIQQYLEELSSSFYKKRNYSPAWTINFSGTPQLDTLIALLDSAAYFGIPKSKLNSFQLTSMLDQLENHAFEENKIGQRITLEIEASQSAILLMLYLKEGFVNYDTTQQFLAKNNTLPNILQSALSSGTFAQSIVQQQPQFTAYNNLIAILPDFLKSMKTVATSEKSISKNRLAKAFYYAGVLETPLFDSIHSIQHTIQKFQKSHSIAVTGNLNIITKETLLSKLNAKYLQLALNIDRLRKTSVHSKDYLFVNIPEYKLYAFEKDQMIEEFRVVVGKKRTPTPTVSSKLEKIIANPYWTVPRSITRNELLPRIRKDSTFLARNRYFVIDWKEDKVDLNELDWESDDPFGKRYWLRQQYGGGNALGKVKFIFPNNYRVYLHDTPSKKLFKRDKRAYSHGCIRVHNPEKLAQYLSDKYVSVENDSVNIKAAIASKKRQEYAVNSNVEVHIQYLTCSVNSEGNLIFFDDIYKKDEKALEELFERKMAI